MESSHAEVRPCASNFTSFAMCKWSGCSKNVCITHEILESVHMDWTQEWLKREGKNTTLGKINHKFCKFSRGASCTLMMNSAVLALREVGSVCAGRQWHQWGWLWALTPFWLFWAAHAWVFPPSSGMLVIVGDSGIDFLGFKQPKARVFIFHSQLHHKSKLLPNIPGPESRVYSLQTFS